MFQKLTIKQRLYLQFLLAALPVGITLFYQLFSFSDLPTRFHQELQRLHLNTQASASYKSFVDGANLNAKNAELSDRTVQALNQTRISTDQLLHDAPSRDMQVIVMTIQKMQVALRKTQSTSALVSFQQDIVTISSLLQNDAIRIEQNMNDMIAKDKRTSDWKNIAAMIAIIISLSILGYLTYQIIAGVIVHINGAVKMARRVSAGDLSSSVTDVNGYMEINHLQHGLNDMNDSLIAVVTRVRSGSNIIIKAAQLVANGNAELSERTMQQSQTLIETSQAIQEFTMKVRDSADNALEAKQLAHSASDVAQQGGEVVAQVVDTMNSINASSKRIVDIISVIDGIAFQTNILALNAAVEAARAGEQGRGFAVVASEVRGLAQRSAAAAKEIKELIDGSVSQIDTGSALVEQAGATMEQIVESIHSVTDIMEKITNASSNQTADIAQLNTSIEKISAATMQNTSLVAELTQTAAAMREQASGLVNIVSAFNLEKRAAPRIALRVNAQVSINGSAKMTAKTVDVSAHGMCLISDSALTQGQQCEIMFSVPIKGDENEVQVHAFSVYCVKSGTDGYMIGMRFSQDTPSTGMKNLMKYIDSV